MRSGLFERKKAVSGNSAHISVSITRLTFCPFKKVPHTALITYTDKKVRGGHADDHTE
jgi:hypothetical protein